MATTKTKPTNKAGSTSSFGARTAARTAQESVWQQYNAEAKFNSANMLKSLEDLAKLAFPLDAFNSNAYQEAIVKSLTETISPEIGVKDFWKTIGNDGCTSLRIIDGHLNFFNNKNEKIDITPYTQNIIFEAHSSFYKQRLLEREQRILNARMQLQSLIKEIHKR